MSKVNGLFQDWLESLTEEELEAHQQQTDERGTDNEKS